MGWTFSQNWYSKKVVVDEVTSQSHWGANFNILKTSVVGNNVWVAASYVDKPTVAFIAVFMIGYDRDDRCYGYKDMDETCHPYQFNCPIGMIKLVETYDKPTGEYALKWRESVKTYHTEKSKKRNFIKSLKSGDMIKYGKYKMKLNFSYGSRRGWNVTDVADRRDYRLTAKQLNKSEIIETGL